MIGNKNQKQHEKNDNPVLEYMLKDFV